MRQTGRKLLRRLRRWLLPTFAAATLAACGSLNAPEESHPIDSNADWAEVVHCQGPVPCPPAPGFYHTTAAGTEEWFAWTEYSNGWSTDDPVEDSSGSTQSQVCSGFASRGLALYQEQAAPTPADLDAQFGKLYAPGESGGKGVQPAELAADKKTVLDNPTVWPDGTKGRKQVTAANAAQIMALVKDAEKKGAIVNFVVDVDGKVWVAAECDKDGKYPPAAKDKALGHPTIAKKGRIAGEVHFGKPPGGNAEVFYINNDSGRYTKPFKNRTQAMLTNVQMVFTAANVPVASTVWVPLNPDAK
jgi:hypothetical protein